MRALGNVFDVVRDRPNAVMDAADKMSAPTSQASSAPSAPPAPSSPIVRGTTNPDNSLPDTEGVFHKAVRRFKGDPVGTKEW